MSYAGRSSQAYSNNGGSSGGGNGDSKNSSESRQAWANQALPQETAPLSTAIEVADFFIGHQTTLAATNAALGDRLEVRLRELSARSPNCYKNPSTSHITRNGRWASLPATWFA